MHSNNTPPAPRGTFPTKTVYAPQPDGFRISPDHRFAGAPTGAVQAEAFRQLLLAVADLTRRVGILEASDDAHGARG
jgi:hypothetical protein